MIIGLWLVVAKPETPEIAILLSTHVNTIEEKLNGALKMEVVGPTTVSMILIVSNLRMTCVVLVDNINSVL
jgi:hypothetical protein